MEKVIHFEEFQERDDPRPRTFEILDELENSLNSPSHFEIIDRIIGEDGTSQELAKRFREYAKKLKDKQIGEKNSLMDVTENLQTSLVGFSERSRKKGLSDTYSMIIKKNFKALNNYLDLLNNHSDFEKAELANEDGFLRLKMKKEDLEKLRSDKIKYIEECKKFFEAETAGKKAA